VACGAFITGCIPESKNPLSPADKAEVDQNLVGSWSPIDQDTGKAVPESVLHISRDADQPRSGGLMTGTWRGFNDGDVKDAKFSIFSTKIGENTYLNLAPEELLKESKGYMILKYRLSGSRLEMFVMDQAETAKAIEAGLILGTAERDRKGRLISALVTDTSENLSRFLRERGDAAIFPTDKAFLTFDRLPQK
jgi:hypothetical protein